MNNKTDQNPWLIAGLFVSLGLYSKLTELSGFSAFCFYMFLLLAVAFGSLYYVAFKSSLAKTRQKRLERLSEIPLELLVPKANAVVVGRDLELDEDIFLPDSVRSRHVHIIGGTGSGKTESVVMNFLIQDTSRGLGAIILDAKGDADFLQTLKKFVPEEKLCAFDLGSSDDDDFTYDPLASGSSLESAQRLFSSLVWSEEYYKSKALSSLQKIFEAHWEKYQRNPTLNEVDSYLADPDTYSASTSSDEYPADLAKKEYSEISGLKDQVRSLVTGHLRKSLSSGSLRQIDLSSASSGNVIYFRLQSLMSPQIVSIVGRLAINHLNFLAGTAHRGNVNQEQSNERGLVPVYLDEFASFACVEFADLISKARSAKFALHFAHQSIGDLNEVSPGFVNRITDNSGTKIVMRISDPDSAEYFSRSFGTKRYLKATQRVTNSNEIDSSELVGEGTIREANQFRASPDQLKSHPTGQGSVLIGHGFSHPSGATSVFRISFPKLETLLSTYSAPQVLNPREKH